MMDSEKVMNALSLELELTLEAMAAAKTLEEKRAYSEIVHNLSSSLGVFFKVATDMIDMDFDDFDDFDDYDD